MMGRQKLLAFDKVLILEEAGITKRAPLTVDQAIMKIYIHTGSLMLDQLRRFKTFHTSWNNRSV